MTTSTTILDVIELALMDPEAEITGHGENIEIAHSFEKTGKNGRKGHREVIKIRELIKLAQRRER